MIRSMGNDLPQSIQRVSILFSVKVKGAVLDIDRYIAQSHSPGLTRKLRGEFAGAHHESW